MYACLTCTPEAKTRPEKRAGVCLACSYRCHDGHELIELYTKRNFRCDCGTSKILSIRCKLDPMKMEDNDKNSYNQNFSGVYCTCKRPYPDPEDNIDDEMIQCVVCEDWYHLRHLECSVPNTDTFEEMICFNCMQNNEFLQYYSHLCLIAKSDDGEKQNGDSSKIDMDVSVTDEHNGNDATLPSDASVVKCKDEPESSIKNDEIKIKDVKTEESNIKNDTHANLQPMDTESENKPLAKEEEILNDEINQCIRDIIEISKNTMEVECTNDIFETPTAKRPKLDGECSSSSSAGTSVAMNICRKPSKILCRIIGSSFWPTHWRKSLCKCSDCMDLYKRNKVEFLTDVEDTVLHYQEKGLSRATSEQTHDRDMAALSNLDHVAQIEVIHGYNKLKRKLTEFLSGFVTEQRTVTSKDVTDFFQKMNDSNKRN